MNDMTINSEIGSNSEGRMTGLMKEVRELGRASAEGKDALPMLAVRVVRAANDGIINSVKDKNGEDDAKRIFSEYAAAEGKKAVHDRSENGHKANVSKLRQLVIFGELTTCDPVDVLNRTITLRQELSKVDGEKLKSPYPAYVDIARTQISTDRDLSDDEIKAVLRKPEAETKEALDILKGIEKKLEKLITGDGGVKDQHELVIAAHENIRQRISALMMDKEALELREKAAALGLTIAPSNAGEAPEATSEAVAGELAEAA